MTDEEMAEKYVNFLDKVSEILGLNKHVDILRLCAVTDEYLKPIEKRIADLENENAELKEKLKPENCLKLLAKDGYIKFTSEQLTKAKDLLLRFIELKNKPCAVGHSVNMLLYENIRSEAEQFLKEGDNEKA